jgi:hypothetical protein
MKKLITDIIGIGLFMGALLTIGIKVVQNIDNKRVEDVKETYSSQCDNSNVAPWSNTYSWNKILNKRL